MPGINRFCVMATIQAARAHLLGLNLEEAYSWGLNKAIFYAAAKRGFKGGAQRTSEFRAGRERREEERPDVFMLGDDLAFKEFKDGKMLFTIGGKVQTPEDFHRQVALRFGEKFGEVWKEAMRIVAKEDRSALLSQNRFYTEVYKPRSDSLVERWSKLLESPTGARVKKKQK